MKLPSPAEERLRELLHERACLAEPHLQTPQQLHRLAARFPVERKKSLFTVTAAAAAVIAVLAVVSLGALALYGHSSTRRAPVGPPLPKPAPSLTAVPLPSGSLLGSTARTFTTPSPDLVVNQVLWVDDIHEATITRVDLTTLRSLGTVSYVEHLPSLKGTLTLAGDIVLLPVDNTPFEDGARILRFNAETGRELAPIALAPIHVTRGGGITVTPLGLFAVVADDTVGVVDAQRGRVTRTFAMPVDHAPTYVDGLLWGWHRQKHTLIGVDPIHGATVREFVLPGFPVVPLLSDGQRGLLLAAPGGETVRLDVRSGRVVARTPVVAANWVPDGTGLLWGVVGSSTLVAVDQETLAMRQSYQVSDLDLLVASPDRSLLFASDHATGRVRRLNLHALRSPHRP